MKADLVETKAQQMPTWQLCIIAFLAMFAEDVLGTVMVVLEASYHAALAGAFDAAGTLAGLASNGIALIQIQKNGIKSFRSIAVICSVLVADFLGTTTGVEIAKAALGHA